MPISQTIIFLKDFSRFMTTPEESRVFSFSFSGLELFMTAKREERVLSPCLSMLCRARACEQIKIGLKT